jgi:hypothetical protein
MDYLQIKKAAKKAIVVVHDCPGECSYDLAQSLSHEEIWDYLVALRHSDAFDQTQMVGLDGKPEPAIETLRLVVESVLYVMMQEEMGGES